VGVHYPCGTGGTQIAGAHGELCLSGRRLSVEEPHRAAPDLFRLALARRGRLRWGTTPGGPTGWWSRVWCSGSS